MSSCDFPVNIGNPAEMTMLEFAKQIASATGSRSKITFKPLPQDDPKQRRPDISRARKYLHWEPKVLLSDGLIKTIEYFRKRI
jgi:nucleoside-diphosphate-sugar epimerase